MEKIKVESDSPQLTRMIAGEFASKISKVKTDFARVITLKGDLGSGKTTFVLGFLNYFGIKPHAASPTFVIMKRYAFHRQTTNNKRLTTETKNGAIYHLDAYRLHSKKDLDILGFSEVLKNPKNIVLIEWPEMIKGMNFTGATKINFSYGKKENERTIVFV